MTGNLLLRTEPQRRGVEEAKVHVCLQVEDRQTAKTTGGGEWNKVRVKPGRDREVDGKRDKWEERHSQKEVKKKRHADSIKAEIENDGDECWERSRQIITQTERMKKSQ